MPDLFGPYRERIAGRSPSSWGMSRMGGARAVEKRIIGDKGDGVGAITGGLDLYYAIREILGYTELGPDSIKLARKPPKTHSIWPGLYAERITEGVGMGRPTLTDNVLTDPAANPFEQFALFPAYELTVEFAPRDYAIGSDNLIDTGTVSWKKPNDPDDPPVLKDFAKEWYRYTTFERIPASEWLTAEAGQFQFDVASGSDPDKRNAVKGQLKMIISQTAYKITWHEVPYSYVDTVGNDSYIEQGLGHVNQTSWYGQTPGTLLFVACNIRRYTPPIQVFEKWMDTEILAPMMMCDIEMTMLRRKPTLGKDAANATATPSAAVNANAIQAGHNYFPLSHTNQWYYAKTTGVSGFTNANNRPAFPSFPFELLFSNPN